MRQSYGVGGEKLGDNEGFWKSNGKKFVVVIVGGLSITALAVVDKIDAWYAVLYWFGAGSVSAGAISRS